MQQCIISVVLTEIKNILILVFAKKIQLTYLAFRTHRVVSKATL